MDNFLPERLDRFCRRHPWLLLATVLVLAVVGIQAVGLLACAVPLLLTTPFVFLLFAVAYCEMTGQRVAS